MSTKIIKSTSILFFITLLSFSLVASNKDELVFLENKDFNGLSTLKSSISVTNNPFNKLDIEVDAEVFDKNYLYDNKISFEKNDLEHFLNNRVTNKEKVEDLVISFIKLYNTIDRNTLYFTKLIPDIIAMFDNVKTVYVKNCHISKNLMSQFEGNFLDSFISLFSSNKTKSYKIVFCEPKIITAYLNEFKQIKIKGVEMSIEEKCRDD